MNADEEIDPDNPLWTQGDFAAARPAREALPPGIADQLLRSAAQADGSPIGRALQGEGPLLARRSFAPHSLRAAA